MVENLEKVELFMAESLKLKSIAKMLANENGQKQIFFIPSYQRGYRWGNSQVEKLLQDINDFANNKTNDEFYPLQPVVVFKKGEQQFELIDGQQRVTTIYIILKYLQNLFRKIEEKKSEIDKLKDIFGVCFANVEKLKDKIDNLPIIIYETRVDSQDFLEDISETLKTENSDFYYMSSAYRTIQQWFQNNSVNFDGFVSTLLNDTKIIWYEIDSQDEKEKRDIFARLNIGKIELTNAELIRALLLNNIQDYKQQISIGYELDKIEYSLRDELFWYFLQEAEKDTKIDLVYELLADTYKNKLAEEDKKRFDKKLDEKYSFYVIEFMLSSNKKSEDKILADIKKYFRFLEEWFADKEFYHKIGYLLTTTKITLLDLISEYQQFNKQNFRIYLDNKIKDSLKKVDLDDLQYGNKDVKKVLLLFNIQTILDNKNITYKFDFTKFKSRKDDIEHIRSQTDPDIGKKARGEWVATLFGVYDKQDYKIKKAQERYKDDKKFKIFYEKISKKLGENKNFDDDLKDSIGNLTLLDSGINRSYGNAFFPIKRAIVLDADRKGTFLPPCTKNVFLKTYSNKISNMMSWDENDIKNHNEIDQSCIN